MRLVSTFQKYLAKEFFKTSILLVLIFTAFYVLVDFFEKLGEFVSYKRPFYYFLSYTFWRLWVDVYQIFPFVVGLAGIVTLLWISKNNELIALLSLGFKKKEVVKHLATGLLVFSVVAGVLLNIIFPKAAYLSLYTWNYQIEHKKKQYLIFNKEIFFAAPDYYLVATPMEPKGEYLKDLRVVLLKNGEPEEVIWAKQGYFIDGKWELFDVIVQKRKNSFAPRVYSLYEKPLPFKPKTLVVVEKPITFLSFKELLERYRFLKKVKRDCSQVVAEMVLKFFYLFVPFILGFFPMKRYLDLYSPKQGGRAFLEGIFWFFSLLLVYLLLQVLFRKGILLAGVLIGVWIALNLLTYLLFF